MNERVKRFWFPSLTILLTSTACLMIFQAAGLRPYFTMKGDLPLVIYLPWLAVLPFLGAGGAYWLRWQRGGRPVPVAGFLSLLKLFASFVGVFIASLLVAVPVCTALGLLAPTAGFFRALTGAILSWVAIPGAALLLGILPFLWKPGSRAGSVVAVF